MRKTTIVLLTISFIAAVTTSAFAAWPWEKKAEGEKAQGATKAASPQQPAAGQATGAEQKVEMPKIVIPRVVVPKIVFEQPPAGRANEPQKGASPQQGQAAPQQPPTMSFGMATGEFISAKEIDPNNIEVKVKTADGKELVITAPATLMVTRRVKLTELNSGEKVMVHYMHNAEDKKDTALYISIGEMPGAQFNVPLPQMLQPRTPPQTPSEKPQGEEKKR